MTSSQAIEFSAPLITVNDVVLVLLPPNASEQLPSRGIVMVEGTINGNHFKDALEPDGKGSHWLTITAAMQKAYKIDAGDTAEIVLMATKDWPEPLIPSDLQAALTNNRIANELWQQVTPMARWDWIRWVRSTPNPATRQKRVEVAMSKLGKGTRRPCCFNRTECTDPTVSRGGKLLEPASATLEV